MDKSFIIGLALLFSVVAGCTIVHEQPAQTPTSESTPAPTTTAAAEESEAAPKKPSMAAPKVYGQPESEKAAESNE